MRSLKTAGLLTCGLFALACTGIAGETKLGGSIKADGSDTVYLISEAMASSFTKLHPNVKISVAFAGTGGGFKKFAAGETDISNASRAIKPAEAEKCKENGIAFTELQVAWDGLAVVVTKKNDFATKMTVEQLKKICHPDAGDFKHAKKWSDVDPSWPDKEIKLWGPGADSGTFDFFTHAINGKEKVIRTDYSPAQDHNLTVKGVSGEPYGIGFFGLAYY